MFIDLKFEDIKCGDIILYKDPEVEGGELKLRVTDLELEDGVVKGIDLTTEDWNTIVSKENFLGIELSIEKIFEDIKFQYSRAANQTANMFSSEHTKFSCKMTYNGKSYQSNYQCNENYSDMDNIKVDFLSCVFADMSCYDCSRDEQDFASNLGLDYWENRAEVIRCYNACKRASERMNEIFDCEELESLKVFFNNY